MVHISERGVASTATPDNSKREGTQHEVTDASLPIDEAAYEQLEIKRSQQAESEQADTERIAEIRKQFTVDEDPSTVPLESRVPRNNTEYVERGGKRILVAFVSKELLYPLFGSADIGGNQARVREDLSPHMKRFVRAHEIHHCVDEKTWGGWLGRELRANSAGAAEDPIGFLQVVLKSVTSMDRIKLIIDRFRKSA